MKFFDELEYPDKTKASRGIKAIALGAVGGMMVWFWELCPEARSIEPKFCVPVCVHLLFPNEVVKHYIILYYIILYYIILYYIILYYIILYNIFQG